MLPANAIVGENGSYFFESKLRVPASYLDNPWKQTTSARRSVSRPINRRLTRKFRARPGPDWPSHFSRWCVIRQAFVFFVPETTFVSAILKEALIWLNAVALIVIIRRGEHLPLRSIGLGTARWWKSILWGFIIAIVSAVAVVHWLMSLATDMAPALPRSRNCRYG